MDEPVNNFFDNSPLLQQLFLGLDLTLDFLQVPANQVRLAQTSVALCNSKISTATTAFPFLIIFKKAFLMHQLHGYTHEVQGAIHQTLQDAM